MSLVSRICVFGQNTSDSTHKNIFASMSSISVKHDFVQSLPVKEVKPPWYFFPRFPPSLYSPPSALLSSADEGQAEGFRATVTILSHMWAPSLEWGILEVLPLHRGAPAGHTLYVLCISSGVSVSVLSCQCLTSQGRCMEENKRHTMEI